MNDVLPKPFTKEGLLHMLEKHLAHLKKPAGMDGMVPPQMQTLSNRQSIKDEDSPAKSPATTGTWNSPNQVPGVSPVASNVTDEYMHPGAHPGPHPGVHPQHPGAYAVSNPMQASMAYNTSPQGQMQRPPQHAGPPPQPQHRRQISDISGGEDMNNPAKRQQMYGAPMQPHTPMNPMQRPR